MQDPRVINIAGIIRYRRSVPRNPCRMITTRRQCSLLVCRERDEPRESLSVVGERAKTTGSANNFAFRREGRRASLHYLITSRALSTSVNHFRRQKTEPDDPSTMMYTPSTTSRPIESLGNNSVYCLSSHYTQHSHGFQVG